MARDEEYDDQTDDPDAPQAQDVADLGGDDDDEYEDETPSVRCPACGHSFPRVTSKCPRCGEWLLEETAASREVPGWLWPTIVALLVAVILVGWLGFGR